MNRHKHQYFVYHLSENVLIFDVFRYIEELGANTVDYLSEWHMMKNEKVIFKVPVVKNYLSTRIDEDVLRFNQFAKEHGCRVLCYYKQASILSQWAEFYEDPIRFVKHCKRACKKRLPNFCEDMNEDLFRRVKGTFQNIPCLLPSGEDEFFLQRWRKKSEKKLPKPLDICNPPR